MPAITLVTNVKLSDEATRSFISTFTEFCSETIGKPVPQFIVDFNYNPYLTVGNTPGPAVKLHVVSLSNTTPENTKPWSEAFFKFFETQLGVPANRGHFLFTDPGDDFVGVGGTTMADLKARKLKD